MLHKKAISAPADAISSILPAFTTTQASTEPIGRVVLGHTLLAASAFLLYLLLNRPEIILLSKLGVTTWYPAIGLAFALMLAVNPRYVLAMALAGATSGMLLYHQSFYSWGVLVEAPVGALIYGLAAYLLRGPLQIDSSLKYGVDVLRYLLVSVSAAIFATLVGVTCLWADHDISSREVWSSAVHWFVGDSTALLSIAPFLLIHILPWAKKHALNRRAGTPRRRPEPETEEYRGLKGTLEFVAQGAAIALALWLVLSVFASQQAFFLLFLPIIWVAMRGGIRRVVCGLLVLNFGVVVSLRLVHIPPEAFTKLGFLMLTFSATGLVLGAAVTERHRLASELQERTDFLNSLLEISPFGILVHDRAGAIQFANAAFSELFLYDPSELTGHRLHDLIVPTEMRPEAERLAAQLNSGLAVHQRLRRMRKDGHLLDVEVHSVPLLRYGEIHGAYVIYKDISDQVKAAVAAREHANAVDRWVEDLKTRTTQLTLLNEMGQLLQSANNCEEVYACVGESAAALFAGADSGALHVLGTSENRLSAMATWGNRRSAGQTFALDECCSLRGGQPQWSDSRSNDLACGHVDRSVDATHLCVPMIAQGETLGVIHIQYDRNPLRRNRDAEAEHKAKDAQSRIAVAAANQIAFTLVNLRLRETLREQAIRDPLTGLYNRRFMNESLERELQRAKRNHQRLAVIFLDLDHFKRFNDNFGHAAGDHVLQSIARLLETHFRAGDMICRYGGEEFAIILPESSAQSAVKRAEMLRTAAAGLRLYHLGIHLDQVTLSMGVAGFPEHAQDTQQLLELADKCLYESKSQGRNQVIAARPDPFLVK
jgi:diguanylate cyclase (GGDEF)-like protein/PAS domain S-box-containing protein